MRRPGAEEVSVTGLWDKYAKRDVEQGFESLELSSGNVQALFNRCLAAEETPNSDVQLSILFPKIMGYEKDSDPMAFTHL